MFCLNKHRLAAFLVLACLPAAAIAEPSFDIGWLAFGDAYTVQNHHQQQATGATGAVMRRAYLTFNAKFTDRLFGRMRFEANQDGEFESYGFDADFKDLYLGWNLGKHKLIAGLTATHTFDLVESIWNSRYLARTPLDLQGLPSRDTGMSLQGPLNAAGTFRYRAMYAAEVSFGKDSGDDSRTMVAVTWLPSPGWTIDLYADWEGKSGPHDRVGWQVFTGYQDDNLRFGALYYNQDREQDPPLELGSVFIKTRVTPDIQLIGRVDRLFEPSPKGDGISYLPFDPTAPATFFLGAVELQTSEHTVLTPNIVYTRYDENDQGMRPQSDLLLRLTLFLNFE